MERILFHKEKDFLNFIDLEDFVKIRDTRKKYSYLALLKQLENFYFDQIK